MKLGELIAMNSLRADLFSLVGLAASHGIPSLDGSDGWDKDGITGFCPLEPCVEHPCLVLWQLGKNEAVCEVLL
jgi:hypothetical protein